MAQQQRTCLGVGSSMWGTLKGRPIATVMGTRCGIGVPFTPAAIAPCEQPLHRVNTLRYIQLEHETSNLSTVTIDSIAVRRWVG